MAVEWVGSAGISSTGSSVNVGAATAGPSVADYRLVSMFGAATCATPTGWTLLFQEQFSGSANRTHLFGRRFQSGDGTTTFSWGSNIYYNLTVLTIRGDNPDGLFAAGPIASIGGALEPTWAAPSLPTVPQGSMRIDVQTVLYNPGQATGNVTEPASMVRRGYWKHATNDIGYPVLAASEDSPPSGTRTFSASPTPNGWYSMSFAVAPVPSAVATDQLLPFFT